MNDKNSPNWRDEQIRQIVRCSTRALIFLSIAWFCLTVGVFTVYPVGPIGIFFLCVGLPCAGISIFYFLRFYSSTEKVQDAR